MFVYDWQQEIDEWDREEEARRTKWDGLMAWQKPVQELKEKRKEEERLRELEKQRQEEEEKKKEEEINKLQEWHQKKIRDKEERQKKEQERIERENKQKQEKEEKLKSMPEWKKQLFQNKSKNKQLSENWKYLAQACTCSSSALWPCLASKLLNHCNNLDSLSYERIVYD